MLTKNRISQQLAQQPVFTVNGSIRQGQPTARVETRIAALAFPAHGSEVVCARTSQNSRHKTGGRLDEYLQKQKPRQVACGLPSVE